MKLIILSAATATFRVNKHIFLNENFTNWYKCTATFFFFAYTVWTSSILITEAWSGENLKGTWWKTILVPLTWRKKIWKLNFPSTNLYVCCELKLPKTAFRIYIHKIWQPKSREKKQPKFKVTNWQKIQTLPVVS